jgi:hypothetical protein
MAVAEKAGIRIEPPELGGGRGSFSDWATQRWVEWTGRRIALADSPWLAGPTGDPSAVGSDFFRRWAAAHGLHVDESSRPRGLVDDFTALDGPHCKPGATHAEVVAFYEDTASYELDVWSQWSPFFRPFGSLLAAVFSRRLEQLNVPLAPLDASLGISNRVLKLRDEGSRVRLTAWVRELHATRRTLYAGSYDVCAMPREAGPCLRVVFPLPNGSAVVIMRPQTNADGSLTVSSFGDGFGGAGFYFFVRSGPDAGWARYVATLKESIRVFVDASGTLRADHALTIFGRPFLELHYRMRRAARD